MRKYVSVKCKNNKVFFSLGANHCLVDNVDRKNLKQSIKILSINNAFLFERIQKKVTIVEW